MKLHEQHETENSHIRQNSLYPDVEYSAQNGDVVKTERTYQQWAKGKFSCRYMPVNECSNFKVFYLHLYPLRRTSIRMGRTETRLCT